MKKLYEILGQAPVKGDVGLEIEVEGERFPDINDKVWTTTQDGSLRGDNREYIFSKPHLEKDVRPALIALQTACDEMNTIMDFSFRTSVHVHINCQQLTYPQYLNFLYTYMLLEEPLMTFCGKERKGNRFCLRIQDAEGILDTFGTLFTGDPRALRYLQGDNNRYAAVNTNATHKYGSLEFRAMRGNMDIDVLTTWVDTLLAIREYATHYEDPRAILDVYSNTTPEEFIKDVLGPLAASYRYPRMVKDMQRNFSLSLELPMRYKTPKIEEEVVEDENKKAKRNFQAMMAREAQAVPMGFRAAMPPPPDRNIQPRPQIIFDDFHAGPERV